MARAKKKSEEFKWEKVDSSLMPTEKFVLNILVHGKQKFEKDDLDDFEVFFLNPIDGRPQVQRFLYNLAEYKNLQTQMFPNLKIVMLDPKKSLTKKKV